MAETQSIEEQIDELESQISEQLNDYQTEVIKSADEVKKASEKQLTEQIEAEASEKTQQLANAAQVAKDKINQQLAQIPQQIEDDLDSFNKKLKSLMGKNIDLKVDVNSPDFDLDVAMGDFKKILNPLLGAISPLETIVGKVPVLGDIMGAITKLTSGGSNGGLSKEDIKKLVPNKPEIPQTLINKIDETKTTIQEFCQKLPMLLINVIFQMLNAIYSMFDQIVGIIGVPPPIFPFNLIGAMPTLQQKVDDFVTNAPAQVKNLVMGAIKEKFAAAMALSTPQLPTPSDLASKVSSEAKEAINTSTGDLPPKSSVESPVQSPVVPTKTVQAMPPEQAGELTWDIVKEKWAKRFHDEFNFKEDDIKKKIDYYSELFDGSNEDVDLYVINYSTEKLFKDSATIKRTKVYPRQGDRMLLSEYNQILENDPKLGYIRLIKASEIVDSSSEYYLKDEKLKEELRKSEDKKVVIGQLFLYPEKKWFGIF